MSLRIVCEYCHKTVKTDIKLNKHYIKCKAKQYKNELSLLKLSILDKDNKLETLSKELDNAKIELKFCNKFLDKLTINWRASDNKTMHIENDIIYLPILDSPIELRNKIFSTFNCDYLLDGQIGVANFVHDHILYIDGQPGYKCSDVSRKMFKFVLKNNKSVKDPRATKLIDKLMASGLGERVYELSKELIKTNGHRISDIVFSIQDLKTDNNVFCKHLAGLFV